MRAITQRIQSDEKSCRRFAHDLNDTTVGLVAIAKAIIKRRSLCRDHGAGKLAEKDE